MVHKTWLISFLNVCIIWPSVGQIDNLYRRAVHIQVARSELSGKFEDNYGFKRKGRYDNTRAFVKQMSYVFNIWNRERHKI